jgi:RNA polymerase sigma-70 factor, ECF subfamily
MDRTAAAVSLDAPSTSEDVGWSDEVMQRERLDPADLMMRREDDAMIQRALNSLPAAYRTAVELCDIEGLTCERISEIMVCPLETVRSRVQEGHLLMKKALEETHSRMKKLH